MLVGVVAWTTLTPDDEGPAGAERIADADGDVRLEDDMARPGELDGVALDDLDLGAVTYLRTGGDGELVVLAEAPPRSAYPAYLLRASADGDVSQVGPMQFDEPITAFSVGAGGHFALVYGSRDATGFLGSPAWLMLREGEYFTPLPPVGPGDEVPDDSAVIAAVDVVDADTVMVGSRLGPYIDVTSPDGASERLLGADGDPSARATTEGDLGSIVSLVRLDDGRVVFVAESDDGYRLHVLDGEGVRPLADGGSEANPVAAPDAESYPMDVSTGMFNDPRLRRDRRAMAPLTPGPDGTVVTVGAGEDRVPEISLVDVDTGEVEVLARLDGVDATIEEPVLATVTGNDLVFTAEGSLWRLPDAVPAARSDGESDSGAARP